MRSVALHEARTADEVWALIAALGARTLVFDVEPLVAVWETDTATLDAGVAETLRRVALVTRRTVAPASEQATDSGTDAAGAAEATGEQEATVGLEAVLFATNSDRLPTELPGLPGVSVGYRASAAKPLMIRGYRDLPRPGLVVGDQIATDGALAWRLGFDFVYYRLDRDEIPFGPRMMGLLGRLIRPLLFRSR